MQFANTLLFSQHLVSGYSGRLHFLTWLKSSRLKSKRLCPCTRDTRMSRNFDNFENKIQYNLIILLNEPHLVYGMLIKLLECSGLLLTTTQRYVTLWVSWKVTAPHTNLSFVLYVCQKLSKLLNIWRSSDKTILHSFFGGHIALKWQNLTKSDKI